MLFSLSLLSDAFILSWYSGPFIIIIGGIISTSFITPALRHIAYYFVDDAVITIVTTDIVNIY